MKIWPSAGTIDSVKLKPQVLRGSYAMHKFKRSRNLYLEGLSGWIRGVFLYAGVEAGAAVGFGCDLKEVAMT